MKPFIISTLLLFATLCSQAQLKPAVKGQGYGEAITRTGALPVTALSGKMGSENSMPAKVQGKVVDVCTKKGCFMKLDRGDGETVMVRFKDYGFFVPADIKGKTVVVDGTAMQETLSVKQLQHYAADAGKSAEEISRITEPKQQLNFEAKGVVVL
ncbi:MAG: DUF4920 domain-containing protein [Mucilaginibacter polytrichastri]|nr:DUF4920 domain-containing protein [Mucilaginibacter polytrichastri]